MPVVHCPGFPWWLYPDSSSRCDFQTTEALQETVYPGLELQATGNVGVAACPPTCAPESVPGYRQSPSVHRYVPLKICRV